MWWKVYVHFINPPLSIFYRFELISYICPSATSTPKKVDKRFPSVSQTRSRFFHVPLASLLSCHPLPPPTRSLDRPLSPMYTAKSPGLDLRVHVHCLHRPLVLKQCCPFLSFVTRLKMVAGF